MPARRRTRASVRPAWPPPRYKATIVRERAPRSRCILPYTRSARSARAAAMRTAKAAAQAGHIARDGFAGATSAEIRRILGSETGASCGLMLAWDCSNDGPVLAYPDAVAGWGGRMVGLMRSFGRRKRRGVRQPAEASLAAPEVSNGRGQMVGFEVGP